MAIPTNQYTNAVLVAAAKYGVPPEVLAGTIQQESGWNPSAVNHNTNGTTDYGIAQLNTKFYPNAYTMTPEQQIDKAASILADGYKGTGNWYDAARSYNAGLTGATSNPDISKSHADAVMGYATQYGFNGESYTSPLSPNVSDSKWTLDNYMGILNGLFGIEVGKPPQPFPGATPGGVVAGGVEGVTGVNPNNPGDFINSKVAAFQKWISANALPGAILVFGGVVIVFSAWQTLSGATAATIKASK